MDASSSHQIRVPSEATYAEAACLLKAGEVVAFPTETVYGLGADASSDTAVARIFEAKGRPRFNPLIVHFANAAQIEDVAAVGVTAQRLAERFWPGALTLVLPRRSKCRISLLCSAGLDSLAVRVPHHPVAHQLLVVTGLPLAAPSANAAGRLSPTTAQHVAESLGKRVPLIIDGGACPIGLESTVLDLTLERPRLLRPGAITVETLEAELGPIDREISRATITSPGMLTSHYAPQLPLRLNASKVDSNEALLAFGPESLPGAAVTENLSETGDLREAAARLFAGLRRLDQPDLAGIAVMPIPQEGLGLAINDRLQRAAAPRA